jgi:CRISPR-associated endonuclease Cas2
MANLFISYDITNDRLRTKTAKILERHGCKRVQKSVFYAARFEAAEVRKLRAELARQVGGKRPVKCIFSHDQGILNFAKKKWSKEKQTKGPEPGNGCTS